MLYFYCSRTAAKPERACAEDILRCLVKEISTGTAGHETDQVPEYIAQKCEAAEEINFASGRLTVTECQTSVARFANDHQKLYIFVDALDEPEERAQRDLSNTALSEAAAQGHQAVVETLLDAGAETQPQEPGPHCPSRIRASEKATSVGAPVPALSSKSVRRLFERC